MMTWDDAVNAYSATKRSELRATSRRKFERMMDHWSPYLSGKPLNKINDRTLDSYRQERRHLKTGTMRHNLEFVARILNFAARYVAPGMDEPMLMARPLITKPKLTDVREPFELSRKMEESFLAELDEGTRNQVLFALHTGCRHKEVLWANRSWIEEHEEGVYMRVPREISKAGKSRLVPLNRVATRLVLPRGRTTILNSAFIRARKKLDIPLTVHDLRHTCASRMRDRGIPPWTIGAVLGHSDKSITLHYARPSRRELMAAVETLNG